MGSLLLLLLSPSLSLSLLLSFPAALLVLAEPSCPTTCAPLLNYFTYATPSDVELQTANPYTCFQFCLARGHSYYSFVYFSSSKQSCYCYDNCNPAALNPSQGSVVGLVLPSCFPNTLNLLCAPSSAPQSVQGSSSGIQYKCCFANPNNTFPILNYPFFPTPNFQPLLTDTHVSSLGTALGYVAPGQRFCFSYVNPVANGPATFSSPFDPLTLASVTVAPSSAGGGALLLSCSAPTFSPYKNKALAKFSCNIANTLPRTISNVVLQCTNFRPLFTSGITPACTLLFSLGPFANKAFSFQALAPVDVTLALASFTFLSVA